MSFLLRRIKSIYYAFHGFVILIRKEASIQVQFTIAIFVTFTGFYFDISNTEWALQLIAIGLVMSLEGLNTAIEKLSDFVHPEHNSKIGILKDISAGAVFIAALIAVIVGLIIYIPKLS